ncbi:MAG: PQQ-binding-like beta-propeller repeat protein [Fuerstiella sp.]|nr:PQQ-binding-like beta-propeller repeat protein [Fuerstiella sp.]MCP4854320.1 PQQ-binding-like beta-propeller repeat protein [Fuerstiella sp.]
MNDQTDSSRRANVDPYEHARTAASGDGRGRFPKKMFIFTGVVLLLIILASTFISEVEDVLGIGLDIVNVISILCAAITLVLWVGWFLIFSRWRWWKRLLTSALVASLPFLFVFIFGPVLGGDLTIQRWEPIWTSRLEPLPDSVSRKPVTVDLSTETSDDFSMFLGENRDGTITTDFQFERDRFSSATQMWKHGIGSGWSGFVARNGYAVTMEQRDDQECITCYRIETGQLQWLYRHTARHHDVMNLGHVGPRATPAIFDGRVYAVGAVGNCVCLNGADGSVVWQADLNEILGVELASGTDEDGLGFQYEKNTPLAWGRSGSPLIMGDLVIVPGGGPAGSVSTLLAFDRLTGEIRWRGGREMIAYGSPVLATVAGRPQILLTAESKVMGFEPDTGETLWSFSRPGESNGGANTSQVSVVSESHVLTSNGYPDGGGELIALNNADGEIVATSIWRNTRVLKTKLTSPVLLDGHSYSLSNGFLECARLADGERIWKQRGRFGHGQLLLVNDQILLHSESGTLYLINATPNGYEELGSFSTVNGICWNTLCLYGNRILIRSEIEAACFELPTSDR